MQQNNLYVSCPACGDEESDIHERMALLRTLCISVLFTMPLLWDMRPIIQLVLASVVQFYPGMYFYKGAVRALKKGLIGMDFLIALSTSVIYFYSAYVTFTVFNDTKVYFLSECVLLSLILFGKYMESTSRYEASSAIRKLIQLQPDSAKVLRDGMETEVKLDEISSNDLIVIEGGEHIPIDGKIVEGEGIADESMLTGESAPVQKAPGETVYCGTLLRSGKVMVSCEDISKPSMLQRIVDIVSSAQQSKAPIARLADKIAGIFVPLVIIAAAGVFALWYFIIDKGNAAQAIYCVCSMLIIACPCALGLATPTAIMTGSCRAAELGVLFRGGEPLENAYKIDALIFDKTGTLTRLAGEDGEILREDAARAVEAIKNMGIDVWMITGDRREKAERIAELSGIENIIFEVKPEDKADAVKKLQSEGKKVAMVGDGINDSPALVCADIGIAPGCSTDIAIDSSDVMLTGGSISSLPVVFNISKRTMDIIRQNLIWALLFNIVCIPLAASGIINPSIAAAAMSLSSNGVLLNSLRIKKFEN